MFKKGLIVEVTNDKNKISMKTSYNMCRIEYVGLNQIFGLGCTYYETKYSLFDKYIRRISIEEKMDILKKKQEAFWKDKGI